MKRNKVSYEAIKRDRRFKRIMNIFRKQKTIYFKNADDLELLMDIFVDHNMYPVSIGRADNEPDVISYDVKFEELVKI